MTGLSVDADSLFAAQAQAALEAAGFAVVVRDDAPIDTLRRLRPQVVVVNVELPRGSGYSICNRVRRDKELFETPILLTSLEASDEGFRRHATTPDRADDYAAKPLDGPSLVARVQGLARLAEQRGIPVIGVGAAA